jgi:hypothetical protein
MLNYNLPLTALSAIVAQQTNGAFAEPGGVRPPTLYAIAHRSDYKIFYKLGEA